MLNAKIRLFRGEGRRKDPFDDDSRGSPKPLVGKREKET